MKPRHSTTQWLMAATAAVALSGGCARIVVDNVVAGLYQTVIGSATGIIDGFFADRFGFEPDDGAEEAAETEEEGNDLHIRI